MAGATKWSVLVGNRTFTQGQVTSLAYCAKGKAPKVVRHNQVILSGAGSPTIAASTATCPKGKVVIGGGWSAPKAVSKSVEVLEGTADTVTATCPGNKRALFGGYRGSYYNASGRNAFIFAFHRPSKQKISVKG